jgi:hypothetical protein
MDESIEGLFAKDNPLRNMLNMPKVSHGMQVWQAEAGEGGRPTLTVKWDLAANLALRDGAWNLPRRKIPPSSGAASGLTRVIQKATSRMCFYGRSMFVTLIDLHAGCGGMITKALCACQTAAILIAGLGVAALSLVGLGFAGGRCTGSCHRFVGPKVVEIRADKDRGHQKAAP